MTRSANQQDVARAAGVSVSTVSRALANSRSVSAELRTQIQQLALELGYRARGVIEAQVTARVYITGNVMSGGLATFYSAVMDGMSEAAREAGIALDVGLVAPVFDPGGAQLIAFTHRMAFDPGGVAAGVRQGI